MLRFRTKPLQSCFGRLMIGTLRQGPTEVRDRFLSPPQRLKDMPARIQRVDVAGCECKRLLRIGQTLRRLPRLEVVPGPVVVSGGTLWVQCDSLREVGDGALAPRLKYDDFQSTLYPRRAA